MTEEFRDVLIANHDAGKGLWMTELGWSSQHPTREQLLRQGQAAARRAQLKGAFRLLTASRRSGRSPRVYWFSVDDASGACNFCDGSGLFGPDFIPKTSWYAFTHFAGGRP